MPTALFVLIALIFGVPLVVCLIAMGGRVRAAYESNDADRIAANVDLQRTITLRIAIILVCALAFGHWMLALTALFAGIAFLVPFWLNTPNRLTGRADD